MPWCCVKCHNHANHHHRRRYRMCEYQDKLLHFSNSRYHVHLGCNLAKRGCQHYANRRQYSMERGWHLRGNSNGYKLVCRDRRDGNYNRLIIPNTRARNLYQLSGRLQRALRARFSGRNPHHAIFYPRRLQGLCKGV